MKKTSYLIKTIGIIALILLALTGLEAKTVDACEEETPKVSSTIKAVTVYLQNAKVSREAEADIEGGVSELVLENLSSLGMANSLQVAIEGDATLLSATYQINHLKPTEESAEVKALKDSITDIGYKLDWLRQQKAAYESEQNLVVNNTQLHSQQQGVMANNLREVSQVHRDKLLEIKKKILDLRVEIKNVVEQKNRQDRQLQKLSGTNKKPTGEIALRLSSKSATKVNIKFSYLVSNAGWSPLYDLRSEGLDKPVALIYKANVYQNTGFDWDEIELTISTGNPSNNNSRPILKPQYVNFYTPKAVTYKQGYQQQNMNLNVYQMQQGKPQKNVKRKKARREIKQLQTENVYESDEYNPNDYFPDEDRAPAPVVTTPSAVVPTNADIPLTVNANQLNVEFSIDTPYKIPSNGKKQLVTMKEFEVDTKYQYHSVPKLDKGAFLLAKVTNWGRLSLLRGQANIFFEGAYIGQSEINPATTADTLLLSLGRDDNITIKRVELKDVTATKFMGSNKRETKGYEIIVRNNKPQAANIEILDQIPISKNKDISVKLEERSGAKYVEDYGSLRWRFTLGANESKKLKMVYTVKYPKNKKVKGS